ncbi:MAG: hypothetical protein LC624_05165 [Halobacteriales archaeon]|nr:hypothetical protein [Halobacteriales archaeon]
MRGALLALAALALVGSAQGLGPIATPADDAASGLSGVFGQLPVAPPGPENNPGSPVSCSGTAPVSTACSQAFEGAPGAPYLMSINGGAGFTGNIVAILTDSVGHHRGMSCAFVAFLGGVTQPSCQFLGDDDLHAGAITLDVAVTAPTNVPISFGYWEVDVN